MDAGDGHRLAAGVFAPRTDPFDRMLIAQALVDGVPIISKDENIARYPVTVIW